MFQKFASIFLALAVAFSLTACVQQPTPFEEPERPTFPEAPSVSIREPQEERTFVAKAPSGERCFLTRISYGSDDVVTRVYGEVSFADKSIADLEWLRENVQTAKDLIEKFDLLGMSVSVEENETSYFEVYDFRYLDQEPDNAYLAASFLGFEPQNETISVDEAAQFLIDFGFTEE